MVHPVYLYEYICNLQDIKCYAKLEGDFPYPIIADEKRDLAIQLGMLDPDEKDSEGKPLTCRAVE